MVEAREAKRAEESRPDRERQCPEEGWGTEGPTTKRYFEDLVQ